jgi:DNA-directed RNA polymerase subunit N (RpoN/RPB10)
MLHCASCGETVGIVDEATNSWRLRKLYLTVSLHDPSHSKDLFIQQWIAVELLSMMDLQACRRMIISDCSSEEDFLLVC